VVNRNWKVIINTVLQTFSSAHLYIHTDNSTDY